MRRWVASIEAEYRRYKDLGEKALGQVEDSELDAASDACSSVTVVVWHLAGNLASRFTDFLTTDGEKPWRRRDEEFLPRTVTRTELIEKWEHGWGVLLASLGELVDGDLERQVTIRAQPLFVREALLRSLAHASYHVGQIVWAAKELRGEEWRSLSIRPGGSEAYNRQLTRERFVNRPEVASGERE